LRADFFSVNPRAGRDPKHLYRIASGSNEELRTAPRIAIAWGYLREDDGVAAALAKIDRLGRMLWSLGRETTPRGLTRGPLLLTRHPRPDALLVGVN